MDSQYVVSNFLLSVVFIGLIFSFILYGIFDKAIRSIIRRINFPTKIRTETGYLYRSKTGVYCSADRCLEIAFELKLKNRQRAIKHHERILNRLKSFDKED